MTKPILLQKVPFAIGSLPNTTFADKLILLLIHSFKSKGMVMFDSTIADYLQCSIPHVVKRIGALNRLGYLRIEKAGSKYRRIFPSEKMLNLLNTIVSSKTSLLDTLGCSTQYPSTGYSLSLKDKPKTVGAKTKKRPGSDDKLKPTTSTDSGPQRTVKHTKAKEKNTDAGFDRFWAEYPKKAAEKTARQVWKKLNPDKTLSDKILAALEKHKGQQGWSKENGRYVPKASNWLADERWKDEIEIAPDDFDGFANSLTHEFSEEEADELYERIAADDT